MYTLDVDAKSQLWQRVVKSVQDRMAELTVEAVDLSRTQEERHESAVRIDELRQLLLAPHETLDRSIAEHEGRERARTVY